MESIDVAAREYAVHMVGSDSYEQNDLEEAFKAGVEFAQDWISVRITPKYSTGCRLDILVKNETFKYPASVKIHTIFSDKDIQELKAMFTHWRPIELK